MDRPPYASGGSLYRILVRLKPPAYVYILLKSFGYDMPSFTSAIHAEGALEDTHAGEWIRVGRYATLRELWEPPHQLAL